jgi:hypothetical protein
VLIPLREKSGIEFGGTIVEAAFKHRSCEAPFLRRLQVLRVVLSSVSSYVLEGHLTDKAITF